MFLKKSSHNCKRRRTSYLFCCFNGFAGNLETPVAATGDVRKRSAACFSWTWLRMKKKPIEQTNNQGTKAKIYRSRSMPPAPLDPRKFAAVVGQVNTEPHPRCFPQVTPKHDTLTRPEPSNLPTEPESSRRKRAKPEPDKQATAPPRFNTRAGSERGGKLESKAGLTVIGVTLAVMVFYGRAAAVVSLCACLYLAAILRQQVAAEVVLGKMAGASYADVDSDEYKKRVVLEGLLDRSKRRTQAHL